MAHTFPDTYDGLQRVSQEVFYNISPILLESLYKYPQTYPVYVAQFNEIGKLMFRPEIPIHFSNFMTNKSFVYHNAVTNSMKKYGKDTMAIYVSPDIAAELTKPIHVSKRVRKTRKSKKNRTKK